MKTINEMTVNELAEYVVTLPGWDQDIAGIQWALYRAKVEGQSDLEPMFLPNLNSPATLGCLLAMARKKHGRYFYVEMNELGGCVPMRSGSVFSHLETESGWWCGYRSEAHALVAALAKEAVRVF